jgi:hypothetical protein
MTTATAAKSLEERIADEIQSQWDLHYDPGGPDDPRGALGGLIACVATPFVDSAARTLEADGGSVWEPLTTGVGPQAIWEDLRPSEAVRLIELVSAAKERAAARCEAIIEQELVAAGVAFAAEYPGARRTEPE